ncbi:acyl-CoA dehydrogenase family protein [Amycolatopsis azurea]|uniref:Acyl-CoA dehydrogenase n=1 Tax=Amycolatopsis azurea DSM 43854 TaxID=1238180 RepID=M2PV33_9PSEU|nr:acyl-CoA dehydrogenase family protein [Amycolatopsis azurea]EMD23410.1 Acyl-CoA dehydrogenase domain protein [Amycolatopsis azurea DSM 43854]OOC04906.1 acyl-CoA dehydrogenase [Amycolatopsis azurea DSM 43854]
MKTLLEPTAPEPLPEPRTIETITAMVRLLMANGVLDLPRPGGGDTWGRWTTLAGLGRRDLVLGRIAEGHTDALAILAEAGHDPAPEALYGVWAARSGGTGAAVEGGALTGTVRFCSGAQVLDRALVVADFEDGPPILLDVDLREPGVQALPETWQAIGMDASDSGDVRFDRVPVTTAHVVGEPGWYVARPGFAVGGAGVAAVWLGGCAAVLDSVLAFLVDRGSADEHQHAHLGTLHTVTHEADALLVRTADVVDGGSEGDPAMLSALCRAAVERTARQILDLAPEITGPTALCRDRRLPRRLADLLVYVRQHHGARDLAALGAELLKGAQR